jgi:hypothetical protein
MNNPSTADFGAWLKLACIFLGQHTHMYASLGKYSRRLDKPPNLTVAPHYLQIMRAIE